MTLFLLTFGWLLLAIALIYIVAQRLGAFELLRPPAGGSPEDSPSVVVVVPARNEAANIERCLKGLLSQLYPTSRLRVVVVDDGSTDGTGAVVNRFVDGEGRVKLIQAGELPEGWTGKAHACWRGAMVSEGEWLCFMDADTSASPNLIPAAVAAARQKGADLLTLQPFQELVSFWERLVVPAALTMVALLMDPRKINDPAWPQAAANGQFILIRHSVYEAVEGHMAVRDHILEDFALARLVKGSGYRLQVMDGAETIQTRMYTGFTSVWEGFSKNAVDLASNTSTALLGAFFALVLVWMPVLLPLSILAEMSRGFYPEIEANTLLLALLGSIATFGALMVAMPRFFRIPLWYGLLFPLGATMVVIITVNSATRRLTGHRMWKGREYSFDSRPSERSTS